MFRSDDYGNSWDVISDDLSRKIDRNKLKVYDRVLSIDAVAKNGSTSPYGTIVALSESPLDENLIVIGTDDGLIQITENSGKTWRKIDNIPDAPAQSYVNSVYLSQHDVNVIYVAFNHHKYGDFKPYIFKSSDRGNSWVSISSNLPIRGSVYSIEEDHVNSNLIFCGTEFGVFFSPDSGGNWKELANGLPTIAVRDIAIQRRENDLVLGTFGRGFYVLDDYSVLRSVKNFNKDHNAHIFDVRDAIMWEKANPLGLPGKAFQGDNFYLAENLDPVAIFTYNFDEKFESLKSKRQKAEKKLIKESKDVSYPTYNELYDEMNEAKPELVFTIRDNKENVVKKIYRSLSKGLSRFHWDLRYEDNSPINLSSASFYNPFAGVSEGTLVNPGTYTIDMSILKAGETTKVVDPLSFNVVALNNTVMPADDRESKVNFQRKVSKLQAEMGEYSRKFSEISNKMPYIDEAIKKVEKPVDEISKMAWDVKQSIKEVNLKFYGDNVKSRLDIQSYLSPYSRLGSVAYYQKYSTAAPTKTHMDSYEIAKEEFQPVKLMIDELKVKMTDLEKQLKDMGAAYTPGRPKAIN